MKLFTRGGQGKLGYLWCCVRADAGRFEQAGENGLARDDEKSPREPFESGEMCPLKQGQYALLNRMEYIVLSPMKYAL